MWWASWAAAALQTLKLGTSEATSTHCSAQSQAPSSQGWGQGQTRVSPQPKGCSSSLCSPKQDRAGGSQARSWGHSTAPRLSHSWRPTPAPVSHSERLLCRKLFCYCLDFVSSSLIYSLGQMLPFPGPALRYQSPTHSSSQQHQDASAANRRRASMESQSPIPFTAEALQLTECICSDRKGARSYTPWNVTCPCTPS